MVFPESVLPVPPSKWKAGGRGATVHAFRRSHWASWMFDVDHVATSSSVESDLNSTILFGAGGFQGCRGGPGQDWFVENVLELLDNVNEHFIDTTTTPPTLYYQPNSTTPSPPSGDLQFEVPIISILVCKQGLIACLIVTF